MLGENFPNITKWGRIKMSKVIKYNLTFLGTIELADEDENLNDAQIISLITEDAYDNYSLDIGYANDVDYSVEEE